MKTMTTATIHDRDETPGVRVVMLRTPALECLVPTGVFDAFRWAQSDVLEWRCPTPTVLINALDADLPLGMAFVLRVPWPEVPTELARLHVGRRYGLTDEMALAPYGIDDATDALFQHRLRASKMFWLAADNLNALFWGLHDWVHFHNHGEFDDPTATEIQCDITALAWLWHNRSVVPITVSEWHELHAQVRRCHHARCEKQPAHCSLQSAERILDSSEAVIELVGGEVADKS